MKERKAREDLNIPPLDMQIGSLHCTLRYGMLEVIGYTRNTEVSVRFITTGYETVAQVAHIRRGRVKDKLLPQVFGVGFVGDGKYSPSYNGKDSAAYVSWHGMLQRCYSEAFKTKSPTYRLCTVCEKWHNFQNFAQWFDLHGEKGLQLDKDILVEGNKIYSPETCIFVTPKENSTKAHAKFYNFISPSGNKVHIYNLVEFCKGRDINHKNMSAVHSGIRNHHKGWVKDLEVLHETSATKTK